MKSPKKILVVDDEEANLFIAQRIIKKLAIEAAVLTARHGQEALEIVKEVYQREQGPELILLDIQMPVMDGFAFLEELQSVPAFSGVPFRIVLLSSSTHPLDLAKARKYPVLDYIEKPLTPEKLSRYL